MTAAERREHLALTRKWALGQITPEEERRCRALSGSVSREDKAIKSHLRAISKAWTVDQSRNGVKVIVHRSRDGSTVDADCSCLGGMRAHSNPECPNRKKGELP